MSVRNNLKLRIAYYLAAVGAFLLMALLLGSCSTESVEQQEELQTVALRTSTNKIKKFWDTDNPTEINVLKDLRRRSVDGDFTRNWELDRVNGKVVNEFHWIIVSPTQTLDLPTVNQENPFKTYSGGFYYIFVRPDADVVVSFTKPSGELIYDFITPTDGGITRYPEE